MGKAWIRQNKSFVSALVVANLTSVALLVMRYFAAHTGRYNFMAWNLTLAWLPVIFAYWFVRKWREGANKWLAALLGLLWLGFLPNSFYLVSDLIHLYSTGEVSILFDTVLYASFIFNGYVAGYLSVYLVHQQLKKRWKNLSSSLIAGVFVISSFAIYLGRNLRWNTWDIILHPVSILFDVSDRIIDPVAHPQSFITTLTFFMLTASLYWVIWEAIQKVRSSR